MFQSIQQKAINNSINTQLTSDSTSTVNAAPVQTRFQARSITLVPKDDSSTALPTEVLGTIMELVGKDPKSLSSFNRVCKQMHALVKFQTMHGVLDFAETPYTLQVIKNILEKQPSDQISRLLEENPAANLQALLQIDSDKHIMNLIADDMLQTLELIGSGAPHGFKVLSLAEDTVALFEDAQIAAILKSTFFKNYTCTQPTLLVSEVTYGRFEVIRATMEIDTIKTIQIQVDPRYTYKAELEAAINAIAICLVDSDSLFERRISLEIMPSDETEAQRDERQTELTTVNHVISELAQATQASRAKLLEIEARIREICSTEKWEPLKLFACTDTSQLINVFTYSVLSRDFKSAQFFLRNGLTIENMKVIDPDRVAHYLCSTSIEIMELLIDSGMNVNTKDSTGNSVLSHLVEFNNLQQVTFLLNKGADIHFTDEGGNTLLVQAILNCYTDMLKLLLDFKANIEIKDKKNCTALMVAAMFSYIDGIELLLEYKADIEAHDTLKETSLMKTCNQGNVETVNLLLNRGAIIEAEDKDQRTALHFAIARCGHVTDVIDTETNYEMSIRIIQLLLGKSANIEARDHYGDTPLIQAVKLGHFCSDIHRLNLVTLLLDRNADIHAVNLVQETPLSLSRKYNLEALTELLLSRGATH